VRVCVCVCECVCVCVRMRYPDDGEDMQIQRIVDQHLSHAFGRLSNYCYTVVTLFLHCCTRELDAVSTRTSPFSLFDGKAK
jgi:hypothetical protein